MELHCYRKLIKLVPDQNCDFNNDINYDLCTLMVSNKEKDI